MKLNMKGKDVIILHGDVFNLDEYSERESDRAKKRKRQSGKKVRNERERETE